MKEVFDKKKVVSILEGLIEVVKETKEEGSSCIFDCSSETQEVPTQFNIRRIPTGWNNLVFRLRFYKEIKNGTIGRTKTHSYGNCS